MALPVLTTAEDVRDLISYLKTKPTGASITEAKAAIKKSVLDPRKFTAYTLWGFVSKEAGSHGQRLSDRGLLNWARTHSQSPSEEGLACDAMIDARIHREESRSRA